MGAVTTPVGGGSGKDILSLGDIVVRDITCVGYMGAYTTTVSTSTIPEYIRATVTLSQELEDDRLYIVTTQTPSGSTSTGGASPSLAYGTGGQPIPKAVHKIDDWGYGFFHILTSGSMIYDSLLPKKSVSWTNSAFYRGSTLKQYMNNTGIYMRVIPAYSGSYEQSKTVLGIYTFRTFKLSSVKFDSVITKSENTFTISKSGYIDTGGGGFGSPVPINWVSPNYNSSYDAFGPLVKILLESDNSWSYTQSAQFRDVIPIIAGTYKTPGSGSPSYQGALFTIEEFLD